MSRLSGRTTGLAFRGILLHAGNLCQYLDMCLPYVTPKHPTFMTKHLQIHQPGIYSENTTFATALCHRSVGQMLFDQFRRPVRHILRASSGLLSPKFSLAISLHKRGDHEQDPNTASVIRGAAVNIVLKVVLLFRRWFAKWDQ